MPIERVSLTGADDAVDIRQLADIAQSYPLVEWAVLYFPEREGTPRNPTAAWREAFLDAELPLTAAHLCGEQVFAELLDAGTAAARLRDLGCYGRIQVNINARRSVFTPDQVRLIYRRLLDHTRSAVILQCHAAVQPVIDAFLEDLPPDQREWVHLLFDSSRGKGEVPSDWPRPRVVRGETHLCGYAGGLSPAILPEQLPRIAQAAGAGAWWIDMESGLREDNRFDLARCRAVLQHAEAWR